MKYASGNIFEGNYLNDRKSGLGTYKFSSGNSFEGNFIDDRMTGAGIYTLVSGDTYSGEFNDGRYDGYGAYRFAATGATVKGYWKDGKLIRQDDSIFDCRVPREVKTGPSCCCC